MASITEPTFARTHRTACSTLLFLLSFLAHAETPLQHKLLIDLHLQVAKPDGTGAGTYEPVEAGDRFSITGKTADAYVITFWRWPTDPKKVEDALNARGRGAPLTRKQQEVLERKDKFDRLNAKVDPLTKKLTVHHFLLPLDHLGLFTAPVLRVASPMVGTALLPFKLRPQDGDFTKDVSLTGMVGVKYRPGQDEHMSLGLVGGIGISSVSLDSLNTEPHIAEAGDRAAITLATGLVAQWDRVQLGVFIGWDFLDNLDRDRWIHNGAHWFSIGIGVAIFSEDRAAADAGTQ